MSHDVGHRLPQHPPPYRVEGVILGGVLGSRTAVVLHLRLDPGCLQRATRHHQLGVQGHLVQLTHQLAHLVQGSARQVLHLLGLGHGLVG